MTGVLGSSGIEGNIPTLSYTRPIDILFLCTGNVCRSPMAEGLLRHRLESLGVDAHVHSAGIVLEGEPASQHGVDVLSDRGIDLSAHRSRRMTEEMLEHADVVIGMAREHVREAVSRVSSVWPKAFTLKEVVRRGVANGGRRAGEPLDAWLARLHAGRTVSDLLGSSSVDDVADPIGSPRAVYERTAAEITELVDQLVGLAFVEAEAA